MKFSKLLEQFESQSRIFLDHRNIHIIKNSSEIHFNDKIKDLFTTHFINP